MFKGFQKPKRLVANTETLTERYGMFIAQPFERGFGSTIGTGLRRVLLSSIEGAAITAVRIDGVAHEFSPIPSVVEDATDIILNLKQVPFKMMGEGTRTVRLKATTPGPVLSGQIELRTGSETASGAAGDLLAIPPRSHSLYATEDSAVLLTVAKLP